MPAHERGYVEEILASREVSRPRLSDDEGEAIIERHMALIDELVPQEMQRVDIEMIGPWAKAVELAKKAENRSDSDETTEQTEDHQQVKDQIGDVSRDISTLARPEAPLATLDEPVVVPVGCNQMFFIEPPYDFGSPTPEQTADTDPRSVYKSTSELAIAETGDLSLGVGGGRAFGVRYPTPENAVFFNFNRVTASIVEIFDFFWPLPTPAEFTVTIDVSVGLPLLHPHYTLLDPPEPYGVVGVIGDCHLTLYPGGPSLGGLSTTRARFLSRARNPSEVFGFDQRYFRVSNKLYLCPGARWVAVVVTGELYALWGLSDESNPGFAGVDLRTPYVPTSSIFELQPAAGPLRVSRMTFMVCPEPEAICAEAAQ
jgi:hypothetical protein